MKAPSRLAVTVAVAAPLLLSGCGTEHGGGPGVQDSAGDERTIKASDINPQPREKVKDGGTLRWGINEFPTQWNRNHVDGNLAMAAVISNALLPSPFTSDEKADISVDTDYVLDAKVTEQRPKQVVTYTLNPKARWSDGKPITWADYQAQWQALSGRDPAFHIVSSTGYQDIEKVARGKDDHEVVVTFRRPFGDWQALFGPLLPADTNRSAQAFNNAWVNRIPVTAGPFKFGGFDQTAKTITIVRDDAWWGARAKLDKIIYRASEQDSLIGAFSNGELDLIDVGTSAPNYARAKATAGAQVRQAAGPDFRHFTFNGASPLLRDRNVRQAIQLGINRQAIAQSDLQGLDWPIALLNNHFFMNTQEGYQDNAGALGAYDPAKAKQLLDAAGWKLNGSVRYKDGKPLDLRFVVPSGVQISKAEGELAQSMLAQIGVKVTIKAVPSDDFFTKYVIPGNFDITPFAYIGTPFPVSSSYGIYANAAGGQSWNANFGRTGSADIDAAMSRAAQSLDPVRARTATNAADRLIWEEVNVLPLYQRPQMVAVRQELANVGARGFDDLRYEDIGFTD
ncbi:Oligopeptide ABC transporter, periplasmic oligopeptide-binding protein OppA (TC 3.A.1.5.1) [[Actinomadura] parvosata subsp. kistnae]|uniref:Peptide ABC transporter substrate-binding protein n=1 Tax=[Actinomadura] parvosata subsp. kistnae TaxID=1909395 RepID=A0A1V0AI39_9ACTN|nr:ABC transporter family substrate-binding protein [Nonomuraea sp. ATCC 55076]AQZ69891.1 peptide ABC transporter substrate-binding protein [Nonomuraea sp. ATCC 55076]SPL90210.1 Oligopeptide ABC transporter, periplasmic oligopeptide-binding protein OppA (TC 3.A.1.5.1) [Actinomadura parvosata subsp. kistnae]